MRTIARIGRVGALIDGERMREELNMEDTDVESWEREAKQDKLDMFASMALIGLCANQSAWRWGSEECARTAYVLADAMLAEHERRAGK